MLKFSTTIKKFAKQGEKTGWTYIDMPAEFTEQLQPGVKKSFRVKGKLDAFDIKGVALIPMGGGNFILPFEGVSKKGRMQALRLN